MTTAETIMLVISLFTSTGSIALLTMIVVDYFQ